MSEYQYDVFISYRHRAPVLDWVKNHFHPLLTQRLPDALPVAHRAEVFIDYEEIETGSEWPAKLRSALKTSRCVVAVWSPEYFRSDWCLAEWQTMRERERLLDMRTENNPHGLIYPVRFFDGDHFPQEAKDTQQKDLSPWNIPHPVFRDTPDYIEFDRQIQVVANDVARIIQRAPDWADWPVITPPIPTAPVVKGLPRL
ncbi:MAG: toll/interleukin-1 receptor domain-containing protein [Acidobacteria bacterium]|nr:toll/interleukin-1 receptor domain-containing protein [Acidobacteriota bacterium]